MVVQQILVITKKQQKKPQTPQIKYVLHVNIQGTKSNAK